MGMYDTVWIDGTPWQTKALGKNLRDYEVGDPAMVERIPITAVDYEEARTHHYDELPRRYLIPVMAVREVIIENGRIVGFASEDDFDELFLDRFDYRGRDEHDQLAHIFGQQRELRTYHPGQLHYPPRPRARRRPEVDDFEEHP
ncbi:hypothetical protein [Gordonia sp. SND2]|uniref:hypothetical protein n=1 Tax=Gordonia sp. SND2 TaxID=3388659 RepID=UPI00398B54EC